MLFPSHMAFMTETMPDKVERVWETLNLAGWDEFTNTMNRCMPDTIPLTEEGIYFYTKLRMSI